jgi:CpXC protein
LKRPDYIRLPRREQADSTFLAPVTPFACIDSPVDVSLHPGGEMTTRKMIEMDCPQCENLVALDFVQAANVTREPELLAQILDLSLNVAECEKCGQKILVDDFMLYHDMDRRFMVAKYPQSDLADYKAVLEGHNAQWDQVPKDFPKPETFRLVFGPFALKEKALLSRDGIDDGPLEVYKIGLLGETGTETFAGHHRIYYFDTDEQGNLRFALVDLRDQKEIKLVKVPREAYDHFLTNAFPKALDKAIIQTILTPPFVSMEKMFFAKEMLN